MYELTLKRREATEASPRSIWVYEKDPAEPAAITYADGMVTIRDTSLRYTQFFKDLNNIASNFLLFFHNVKP